MTFEELFPGFATSCTQLHDNLMPAATALLVLSFAFYFWSAAPDPVELIKFLAKLFLIMFLITHSREWIDTAKQGVRTFVQNNVEARPENVAERFKERLNAVQNSSQGQSQSWWDMLFSANIFEAVVYADLWLSSWFAMVVLFYVSLLQDAVLLLYWVISPLLFACFAIPMVGGLAMRHFLRIVGTLLWPLGHALAATITDGLLEAQTSQFGNTATLGGTTQYVLMNLLSITVIAIWILVSSILAPIVIQRLFAGQAGAASLITRAASLVTGVGFPLVGATVAASGIHRERESRNQSPSRSSLVELPEFKSASPTDAPSTRVVSDDDPTAGKAVKQLLEDSENH